MASIIEGYNYDIFISYRQKDNKGDKWVSRFVDALNTELESTFKEDISVYFDENPHDRLQETHNVDKSLEGKLKCLIFIPILSQTYCDPNSYAWQYEFRAFLKLAGLDRLGKDVRLNSGNVANRILPVRIHDLEPEDVKLFEKETGSVLRSMDFVFKTSTGVSRPLKDSEDHPQDNLNKTFYNDQLNKVGHAIKEIISGLKTVLNEPGKEKIMCDKPFGEFKKEEEVGFQEKRTKTDKHKLLSTFAVLIILLMVGLFVYPKIFKKNTIERLRSSGERIAVAVMPFQNLTNESAFNVYSDVIQTSLANLLSNYSEELRVRQTESVNVLIQGKGLASNASITPSLAGDISQKLNADLFVFGIISKNGAILRANAQVTDSKTEEIIRSFQVEGPTEKIYPIIDSLSNMVRDFLIISKFIKEVPPDVQHIGTTNSPEASKYYTYGFHVFYDKRDYVGAREWFLKALKSDTNFVGATIMISYSFGNQGLYNEAKVWCLKAYAKKELAPLKLRFNIDMAYAFLFNTPAQEIKYCLQLLEIDDQAPHFYYRLGNSYSKLLQYSKVIPALEKALEIYNNWGVKPQWIYDYTYLGMAYHLTGQYDKERDLYKRAEKEFPDDDELVYRQAILSLSEKDTISANKQIEKLVTILKNNLFSEAEIVTKLAEIYSEGEILDKAEDYYRKAILLQPNRPENINDLAYFLVDKNINIVEGLEIVHKAIDRGPDNYNYLHTKGLGLYKQGKYQEALEILQKSWDLRREEAVYNHEAFLHLESAKRAIASQKSN